LSPVTVEAIELNESSKKWLIVNYVVMLTSLRHRYPAVAQILTHSVNLGFGPKSGFKNRCWVRACDFELGPGSGFEMKLV